MPSSLPKVQGTYSFNTPLAQSTWLKVGGPADIFFKPKSLEDLTHFLKNKPKNMYIFPMGLGSNLLVRDGGIRGVVMKLGRGFTQISEKDGLIVAGAGALDRNVSLFSADAGLTGLEFLSSIPGTIGGAIKMNAGCYGTEIQDILVSAKAITLDGEIKDYSCDELLYSYRHCGLTKEVIFVEGTFKPTGQDTPEFIHSRISDLLKRRAESQPTGEKTGGSTFKNPDSESAWKLIDQVGGRGLRLGGAMFSEKHCNFLINQDNATATEIEDLAENIRKKVLSESGVDLVWEVIRVGERKA